MVQDTWPVCKVSSKAPAASCGAITAACGAILLAEASFDVST